jgi:hypothetical protein
VSDLPVEESKGEYISPDIARFVRTVSRSEGVTQAEANVLVAGAKRIDSLITEVQQLREERDRWVHDFAVLAEANASNSADRIAAESERDRYAAVIEKALAPHVEREWRKLDGTYLGGTICDQCRTDYPCQIVRALASVDSGSALAEVKAQALTDAAHVVRSYPSSHSEHVASILDESAEQIRKEGKSND